MRIVDESNNHNMFLNKDNAASPTAFTKRALRVWRAQYEACPGERQGFPVLGIEGLTLKTSGNPTVTRQSIQVMGRFLFRLGMPFRLTPLSPRAQMGNARCVSQAQKQEQPKGKKL